MRTESKTEDVLKQITDHLEAIEKNRELFKGIEYSKSEDMIYYQLIGAKNALLFILELEENVKIEKS